MVFCKLFFPIHLFLLLPCAICAQPGRVYSTAEYAAAEKLLTYNVSPLVYHSIEHVGWLPDNRFWYRDLGLDRTQFLIMDASTGKTSPAFNETSLASAATAASGKPADPRRLPVVGIMSDKNDPKVLLVTVLQPESKRLIYRCTQPAETGTCTAEKASEKLPANSIASPDGKKAAFIRDWNLWVRDTETGEEKQLTKDGAKNFGYATDNAGWAYSEKPILLWSPDSKRIATFQQDERKTGDMYLVNTQAGHPRLEQWKYPMPGDKDVTMIERVIIDLGDAAGSPKLIRLQMPPDQHRSTVCDHIKCGDGWTDVEWAEDGQSLAFVSTSRDHKHEVLRIANATSGAVRDVMHEDVATQYESGQGHANWRYLPKSNEVIWFSERDNWGHLYLYNLDTGKLKHRITAGEGNVVEILRVDEKERMLYFTAVGKEQGRDPYYLHAYRIGLDGKGQQLLTTDNANHDVTMSKDGQFFTDVYSTPDTPSIAVVRKSHSGEKLAKIAQTDIAALKATGWIAPIPFHVKARDNKTDIYGLLWKPQPLDETKKYPLIDYIYPGPQTGSCGTRSFAPARSDNAALSALGFAVVCIDGMGTPFRSKSFHDTWYGKMGDNTLPDQVAAIKQLAQQYSWIDLDRVGMWGHSGGGNATADALLQYPDFFKVGIAESGNHDNRLYEDDWGERYQGLLVTNDDKTSSYDNQSNPLMAKNLKGKLLLSHGSMDNNVPPYQTLQLVDALIKANKTFDFLMLPNARHGYASSARYMMRRRWDYFVQNLMAATPPPNYQMSSVPDTPAYARQVSGANADESEN